MYIMYSIYIYIFFLYLYLLVLANDKSDIFWKHRAPKGNFPHGQQQVSVLVSGFLAFKFAWPTGWLQTKLKHIRPRCCHEHFVCPSWHFVRGSEREAKHHWRTFFLRFLPQVRIWSRRDATSFAVQKNHVETQGHFPSTWSQVSKS